MGPQHRTEIFSSNYNGLQVTATQRLAHHVSASGYYTGRSQLATFLCRMVSGWFNSDINNLKAERSRNGNDLTHQAVMSVIWQPEISTRTRSPVNCERWELLHCPFPLGRSLWSGEWCRSRHSCQNAHRVAARDSSSSIISR